MEKFQPGTKVQIVLADSPYNEQTGIVYDNYRSGAEPQSYGVHLKDGTRYWFRETELIFLEAPKKE